MLGNVSVLTPYLTFAVFLLLVVVLNILLIRVGKNKGRRLEAMMEEERAANSSRKKEIPEELFICVNKGNLPFREYEKTIPNFSAMTRAAESVSQKIKLRMLKLPIPMNNLDIKLAYGVANFELVVMLEENYDTLLKSMLLWADELLKAKIYVDAQKVLEETIIMKSDYSRSYNLMASVCSALSDKDGLNRLNSFVSNGDFMKHDIRKRDKVRADVAGALKASTP